MSLVVTGFSLRSVVLGLRSTFLPSRAIYRSLSSRSLCSVHHFRSPSGTPLSFFTSHALFLSFGRLLRSAPAFSVLFRSATPAQRWGDPLASVVSAVAFLRSVRGAVRLRLTFLFAPTSRYGSLARLAYYRFARVATLRRRASSSVPAPRHHYETAPPLSPKK